MLLSQILKLPTTTVLWVPFAVIKDHESHNLWSGPTLLLVHPPPPPPSIFPFSCGDRTPLKIFPHLGAKSATLCRDSGFSGRTLSQCPSLNPQNYLLNFCRMHLVNNFHAFTSFLHRVTEPNIAHWKSVTLNFNLIKICLLIASQLKCFLLWHSSDLVIHSHVNKYLIGRCEHARDKRWSPH